MWGYDSAVHESLAQFHPVIARWFEEKVGVPTPPQVMGWPGIGVGKSTLILAPTGSGKTLAAFLAAIDWLAKRLIVAEAEGKTLWGVQILYISPLKALANDVQKNLLRPIEQLAEMAAAMKVEWPEIHVAIRTGDTPQKERAALARRPPHILVTTPESLNLMLSTAPRMTLGTTRYVIVDEVHALAGSKRGVFLSVLLERLEEERRGNDEIRMTNDESNSKGRMSKKGAVRRGMKIAPGVYVPVEPVGELIRIGLSATARPETLIARWLAGYDDAGSARPIEIVQAGQRKLLDLQVICPFSTNSGDDQEDADATSTQNSEPRTQNSKPPPPVRGTGHWPEVTRETLRLIREHKGTLVFGNSRQLIERLAARFQEELQKEAAAAENHASQIEQLKVPVILPHHGSIAKEVRLETEQALKRGEVDAVLATSSLELGIDIGSLDLVVQIDSPGNVAAGLQRVGRSGHLERATAKGRFIARGLFDLPSFGALLPLMFEGRVEETRVPENCLDIVAQQVVAACAARPCKRADVFRMFRRATPFVGLAEKQFDGVVAMLSKRAERVTAQGLRPRISFDRVNDELTIMPGAALVLLVNGGVISDTGQFPVYLAGAKRGRAELGGGKHNGHEQGASPREEHLDRGAPGVRLGELDEEFVYETKEGDRIILGSQTWRVVRIDADRVLVEHATPGSSRMPFWRGERPPRSEMLGEALARFNGEMEKRLWHRHPADDSASPDDAATLDWLTREHHFDAQAADNALVYFRRQLDRGALPHEDQIVVEHFIDRAGEPIIAIMCPLGRRVNYALRLAMESQFAKRRLPAQLVHHDDGLIIRPPVELGAIPENPLVWLKAATLEDEIVDQLEGTALFGLRFRQNAARALMLPKMALTQRTPLWQQRLRARHLLALVKKQRNFPIIVETYRECLQDALNIPKVAEILSRIESGTMKVKIVRHRETGESGSPMARSLFSQFTQAYLYTWDDPLVAKDLEPTVDRQTLDEILQRRAADSGASTAEASGLEKAWTEVDEESLRRRIWGLDYPARTAEELLEKIELAGAVGIPEEEMPRLGEWVAGGHEEASDMLASLMEKRRILLIKGASAKGSTSPSLYIATETLSLLIAARGKVPGIPRDLPAALLESTMSREDARRAVVEQVIKAHPTFTRGMIAETLPWMSKEAETWLQALEREGRVLPVGERLVWAEYAEQLRAMALRRERRAASTVDLAALQRHLLEWQRVQPVVGTTTRDTNVDEGELGALDATEDILDLFTGLSFPLEFWEYEVLPARVPAFSAAILDGICRNGHRVWVGSGDGGDVAIAFWPRQLLGQRAAPGVAALSAMGSRVRDHLQAHGASFQFDLQIALTLDEGELALALRELAAAGLVSCDDLHNLREVQRVAANAARDESRRGAQRVAPRPPRLTRNWWKHSATTAGNLGGRWFLLPPQATGTTALDVAQRAADRAERFLRRTGFACRELLEAADGPWKDAYDVLTRMEWAGSVRRGYFVDGISGAQFADPRTALAPVGTSAAVTWLSMLDPANVWSRAATRWITDSGLAARVPRVAGSWVALVRGHPVLAATGWGQRLIPLPASDDDQRQALATVATLLPRLPRTTHPHLAVRHWDQQEIVGTPAAEILREQGFTRDTQGMRLYRSYSIQG